MAQIELIGLSKEYDGGVRAVRGIDLLVASGELMVLVGPSGSGKSTILRMIAGLEQPTTGSIVIGGRPVDGTSAKDRNLAMVFQSHALYPHLDVASNIAFGLRMRGVSRVETAARVARMARLLEIDELLERRPGQLSGGQRQRVAMGRALVREPRALLMDEPMSSLDAQLRGKLRAELALLQRTLAITTILVTHDQGEAMTMGHRVAVLREGRLQQVATPDALYRAPMNVFTASFIGSPPINLLECTVKRLADGVRSLVLAGGALVLPVADDGVLAAGLRPLEDDRRVIVGVRPEDVVLTAGAARDRQRPGPLPASVALRESLGSEVHLHLDTALRPLGAARSGLHAASGRAAAGAARIVARAPATCRFVAGDHVQLTLSPRDVLLFDAETGASLTVDAAKPRKRSATP